MMIEKMGGKISLESKLNEGTTVKIILPTKFYKEIVKVNTP